jgi:hypothetical protein
MLGIGAFNRNQPDEAEKYLLESEQILRQTLGDQNGYLVNNLDRQAAALYQKNDLRAAEAKAREAIAVAQAVTTDKGILWAVPVQTLGDILTKAGRAREGEDCYRQSLSSFEGQSTKNYYTIANLKLSLSRALLAQHRLPEAERVALEARDEASQHLGDESPVTKSAEDNLLKISEKRGARH